MYENNGVYTVESPVYVQNVGLVGGLEEKRSFVGQSLDEWNKDLYFGESSFECAEQKMVTLSINHCLHKSIDTTVDAIIAGDLTNQMIASHYAFRQFPCSFLGVFSACATSMEAIGIGALLLAQMNIRQVICTVSSHIGVTNRQFRYPIGFATVKPQSAMRTVTGAASVMLSKAHTNIKVRTIVFGNVIDDGTKNPLDLGRAMAPAAVSTLKKFLGNDDISTLDAVITGDLSQYGSEKFLKLCKEEGIELGGRHIDAGIKIYEHLKNEISGGSGAACSALVIYSYVFDQIKKGVWKKVLCLATGALFNSTKINQSESIPCIAHGIVFEFDKGGGLVE
ncbi:beta-ketoacyl-[acyl-carrier-protein] synthase family protein [Evansella halocellulosilytica]|uniref:stage V sporulation protein AD n=1 Tax=Evansella halocellulosilytica TaxID=2011013 RepID=UPI000BB80323|nr:stage V sporulation protein AD [Evansella halocellulosilytica]